MADNQFHSANTCLKVGLWGSVIAAICCSTPVFVVGLSVLGFAALTPYLDYVLVPALALFLIVAGYGLWERKRRQA